MATPEWTRQISEQLGEIFEERSAPDSASVPVDDFKTLLRMVVDQVAEMDRRHAEGLRQMQERIAELSADARNQNARAAVQVNEPLDRIAADLPERTHHFDEPSAPRQAEPRLTSPASDQRMALRSARDETAAPARASVRSFDNFDVVETSIPGNAIHGWSDDAAEALADLYDTPDVHIDVPRADVAGSRQGSTSSPIDQGWLDARLTDIAARVEQSLSDVHPAQSFFALNQRLDQIEQHFTDALAGRGEGGSADGMRLLEAHIGEIVAYLDESQKKLERLDSIEADLSAIGDKLLGMTGGEFAAVSHSANGQPFDVEALANAAAIEAVLRLSEERPSPASEEAIGEVRGLVERLVSEVRQGESHTTALLETMQQAMLRVLDRVDALDDRSTSKKPAPAPAAVQTQAVPIRAPMGAAMPEFDYNDEIELPEPQTAEREEAEVSFPERKSDKQRKDFIAEARRAKMRLASDDNASRTSEVKRTVRGAPAAHLLNGEPAVARPGRNLASHLPRVAVIAIAVLTMAAGGLWFALPREVAAIPLTGSSSGDPLATPSGPPPQHIEGNVSPSHHDSGIAGAEDATDPAAASPAAEQRDDTHGDASHANEFSPSQFAEGATSVPLLGVAVDTEKPVTAEDLRRARRRQTMATLSGKLGENAADDRSPLVHSAKAFAPGAEDVEPDTAAPAGVTRAAPLDLPPATVGPLSLRMAAANGDPSAEFEVGARLAEGKGTDQNFKDAAKWYQKAAARGFAQAQYRLGTLFERGLGMKADIKRAEDWYQRAAEQGNVKAMHNLAVLSTNQSGATPDYATASMWFNEAAQHGLADSQFNLAVLYENGLGVQADKRTAYKWLALAARGGDKEAIKRVDILKGKMTVDELADAERSIKSWRSKPIEPIANDARIAGEAWKKNPSNGVNG